MCLIISAARLPYLSKNEVSQLIVKLVVYPVQQDAAAIFLDAMRHLDNPVDIGAIAACMNTTDARAHVSSELIFALPAHLRQAVWKAAPSRCDGDLLWALTAFQRSISDLDEALDLLKSDRSRPRLGEKAVQAATKRNQVLVSKRQRSNAMQQLFQSVKGDASLHDRVCTLLQRLWERDRDPRWCAVRYDLYTMQVKAAAPQPCAIPDPLAPVIVEIHKALNMLQGGSIDAILAAAKSCLRRRARVDRKVLSEKLAHAVSVVRDWVRPQKAGQVTGATFEKPVIEQYPALKLSYQTLVKHPMDLRTMETKAARGDYGSVDDALADAQLIVNNCKAFNGPNSEITLMASKLERALASKMNQVADEISKMVQAAGVSVDTVITTFENQSAVVQLLMLLSDPLLTRMAVQVAYHNGIAGSARAGTPLTSDAAARSALTLLAAGDVGNLEPAADRPAAAQAQSASDAGAGSSTAASSSSSGHGGPEVPRYSGAAYEQYACALGEILGLFDQQQKGKTAGAEGSSSSTSASSTQAGTDNPLLPLPLATACTAMRSIVLDAVLGQVQAVASAAGVEKGKEAPHGGAVAESDSMMDGQAGGPSDGGAASGAGASASTSSSVSNAAAGGSRLSSTSPSVQALAALRRGKHPNSRSVALLATFTGCTLTALPQQQQQQQHHHADASSAAEPPFDTSLLLAIVLGPSTTAASGADGGVPEPASLVTVKHAVSAVIARLAKAAAPAAGAGGLTNAGDAGLRVINTMLERLFLPCAIASSGLTTLRPIAHAAVADVVRLGVQLAGMRPDVAADHVTRAIASLTPSRQVIEASVAAYPRTLGTLFDSSYLQPLAAIWMRPDMEPVRSAYAGLVSTHFIGRGTPFDWTSLGLAPTAAVPPMPSASPASTGTYGTAGTGGFAAGVTPGSAGVFGYSPVTPGDGLGLGLGMSPGSGGGATPFGHNLPMATATPLSPASDNDVAMR